MNEHQSVEEQIEFFDRWNAKYRGESFDQIEPESRGGVTRSFSS